MTALSDFITQGPSSGFMLAGENFLGQSTRVAALIAVCRHRLALSCARAPQHQVRHPPIVRGEPARSAPLHWLLYE